MIIEKDNQLDDFLLENQNKDCFIIPILSDVNRHPLENSLCAVYVKIVDGEEGLLCFNHGETLRLSLEKLLKLDKLGRKFVRDKKQLNHIMKNVWNNPRFDIIIDNTNNYESLRHYGIGKYYKEVNDEIFCHSCQR